MKILFQITWILILSLTVCDAQKNNDETCARTRNLSYRDIKKQRPYNQTDEVRLISFKSTGEGKWEIPRSNGTIDPSRFFESNALNQPQVEQLFDLLMNYNYNPNFDGEVKLNLCWIPRNAILFCNKKGEIVGYIELCFECSRFKTEPEQIPLGDFCIDKWDKLKLIFKETGIKYGTDRWD